MCPNICDENKRAWVSTLFPTNALPCPRQNQNCVSGVGFACQIAQPAQMFLNWAEWSKGKSKTTPTITIFSICMFSLNFLKIFRKRFS